MLQSPLNYTGGKYKLLPQILPLFPKDLGCFVDLFCGGCNVGINVSAESYIYNDCCAPLIQLYSIMQTMDSAVFINKIEKIIKKYELSDVKVYGYDFYHCSSSDGLGAYNKDKYLKLRADFNALKSKETDYYIMLYVLIVYAFNNQIRFNRNGEFNLPVGKRDFNQKMCSKLKAFMELLHNQNAVFLQGDIVIYEKNQVVMLEATLMNASSQKRGEWEPVLRHSINLKVEEEKADTGREVTTFFIADSFDYNTINIWKAVAAVPLQSSVDKTKFTDNVVIMPVHSDELAVLMDKHAEYDSVLSKVHKLFEVEKVHFDIDWRKKFMGKIV